MITMLDEVFHLSVSITSHLKLVYILFQSYWTLTYQFVTRNALDNFLGKDRKIMHVNLFCSNNCCIIAV